MRKYHFSVLIEQDEDGVYVATVPQLRGCHTQAKTLAELYPRIEEAIELCLEVQQQGGSCARPLFPSPHWGEEVIDFKSRADTKGSMF